MLSGVGGSRSLAPAQRLLTCSDWFPPRATDSTISRGPPVFPLNCVVSASAVDAHLLQLSPASPHSVSELFETCQDVVKEEKDLEKEALSVTERSFVITSRELQNPLSAVWLAVVE